MIWSPSHAAYSLHWHILADFSSESWKCWWMARDKGKRALAGSIQGYWVHCLPLLTMLLLTEFSPRSCQLKYLYLLLLVAAAFHSNTGGSVNTRQLKCSTKPSLSAYWGSASILINNLPTERRDVGGGRIAAREWRRSRAPSSFLVYLAQASSPLLRVYSSLCPHTVLTAW